VLGVGVAVGVGLVVALGVELGVGVGLGVGVDEGPGVGVAAGLLTVIETYAVPMGAVPPCWKTRTIRVCAPFATVVEFQMKFPFPDSTLTPST
jgi:hypothetical protein